MYLLGHTATGVILGWVFNKLYKEDSKISLLIGAIAVMIPDLIDKPIGSMFFGTGRWIGHSLLFINSFGVLLFLSKSRWMAWLSNKGLELPKFTPILILAGMYLHLLGDMPTISHIVMFWPLFGPFPVGSREDFLKGLMSPITQVGESLGFLFHVWNGKRLKWNIRSWSYFGFFLVIYFGTIFVAWYFLIGF